MAGPLDFGVVYKYPAIPPLPDEVTWIEAGPLRIGVEYRHLTRDTIVRNFEEHPEVLEGKTMEEFLAEPLEALDGKTIDEVFAGPDAEDKGVSIHVEGIQDGHEYLRFDCFESNPHYHYLYPDEQRLVGWDPYAGGSFFPWIMECLRTRIVPMLEFAGGTELVRMVDQGAVTRSVDEVEQLAGRYDVTTAMP